MTHHNKNDFKDGENYGCCRESEPCCDNTKSQSECEVEVEKCFKSGCGCEEMQTDSGSQSSQDSLGANEIDKMCRELAEYKDKYLRLLAEMENMRKRMLKERQDSSKLAVESVVLDLLAPFDQFESALKYADQMSSEVRNWAVGFNMILSQLKDALSRQEIYAYDAEGKQFDPYLHEAIETIETDSYTPGIVVKQFYKGYKMGDRIIRPAKVQVAKAKQDSSPSTESNEDKK